MTNSYKLIVIALIILRGLAAGADAPSYYPAPEQAPPTTGYHDCITHSCRLVPEVKQIKKTVYEVQQVPYCVKKCPPLWTLWHAKGCDCEACAECDGVRYRKVLVKREIVCDEICTSKCVVEARVERVPCCK